MAALLPAERIGGLASLQPGLRPMSASGHQRKCSEGSNDFRSAALNGHDSARLAGPLSATSSRRHLRLSYQPSVPDRASLARCEPQLNSPYPLCKWGRWSRPPLRAIYSRRCSHSGEGSTIFLSFGMRQRPVVLKCLADIAALDPATAGRTADEMLSDGTAEIGASAATSSWWQLVGEPPAQAGPRRGGELSAGIAASMGTGRV
jgi:hypothetical protein